jgi:hypothetical protein
MPTSKSPNFTTSLKRLTRTQLHKLLNNVARKAYEVGYKDAAIGLKPRPEKVAVAEKHLWKIP